MKCRSKYTPDQRNEFLAKIKNLQDSENITVQQACDKIGLKVGNYYTWTKKAAKISRKSRQKRNKKETVLVTDLVPIQPEMENNKKINSTQIAEMLAIMNANSLRALLAERLN